MSQERPLILITNDDGYEAKGLASLIEAAASFGDVVAISTDMPRSGNAHAITMNVPLRLNLYKQYENVSIYRTNGTPVDCVKLGQRVVLKDRKIDLILSGINHGSNSSVSLIYSGTMAAALEGSFDNTPSIGFSLLNYSPSADFSTAKEVVKRVVSKVLADGMPDFTCLNVNIPDVALDELKGMKITRQTMGCWHEDLHERVDTFGRKYYWLSGYLKNTDPNPEDTCEWALQHNYVSIQPVQFDMTAYKYINDLKKWEE